MSAAAEKDLSDRAQALWIVATAASSGWAGGHPDPFWAEEVCEVLDACTTELSIAEKAETKAGLQRWRDWINTRVRQGARDAHLFLRNPEAWLPSTTRGVGEAFAAVDETVDDDDAEV